MSENYPDIEKMIADANNPDIGWDELPTETQAAETPIIEKTEATNCKTAGVLGQEETPAQAENSVPEPSASNHGLDRYWQEFVETISQKYAPQDKGRRVFCQLDRDIVDSLDECDIYGRCRSDIVNTIIRQFIKTFLPRLAEYKRERQSFFDNLKTT